MRRAIPPLPDISSWVYRTTRHDSTSLLFHILCVSVVALQAIIMNNKIKSVTETETGKCDFGCLTRVFAILTDVATLVTNRQMKYVRVMVKERAG